MLLSLLSLTTTLVFAGDVPSGPMVGDKLPEFKVQGFFTLQEGKEFEVLKEAKDRPVLIVFVHQLKRPAFQLIRPLDEFASKQDKLFTLFVWLGEKEKSEEFLKRAKGSLNLQSPVAVALEKDGPMTYGLNDRATLTILLAKNNKVVNNFAYSDPNGTNAREVIRATAKLLGIEEPKAKEDEKKKRPTRD